MRRLWNSNPKRRGIRQNLDTRRSSPVHKPNLIVDTAEGFWSDGYEKADLSRVPLHIRVRRWNGRRHGLRQISHDVEHPVSQRKRTHGRLRERLVFRVHSNVENQFLVIFLFFLSFTIKRTENKDTRVPQPFPGNRRPLLLPCSTPRHLYHRESSRTWPPTRPQIHRIIEHRSPAWLFYHLPRCFPHAQTQVLQDNFPFQHHVAYTLPRSSYRKTA